MGSNEDLVLLSKVRGIARSRVPEILHHGRIA
jgi:hypothetical protein